MQRNRPTGAAGVERLHGHGIIRHGSETVGEADYDLMIASPSARASGRTYEAGLPGTADESVPDITGRLMGRLYQAQQYAEGIHTLVLEDGRAFDFRVLRPDTNEIVGVSWFRLQSNDTSST